MARDREVVRANGRGSLRRSAARFYARGWVLGTSGNFSAVVSRASRCASRSRRARCTRATLRASRHPASATSAARVVGGDRGKPSAETLLHLEIVRRRGAGAVLHTHSVWSTMLSESARGRRRGSRIEGYEMLKGLDGVAIARAPRVDSDRRQRSGHAAAGRARRRDARRASGGARVSAAPPRPLHLGRRRSPTPSGTSRFSSSCSRRSAARKARRRHADAGGRHGDREDS